MAEDGRCTNGYCPSLGGAGPETARPIAPVENARTEWDPNQISPYPRAAKVGVAEPFIEPIAQRPTAEPFNEGVVQEQMAGLPPAAAYKAQQAQLQQGATPQQALQIGQEEHQRLLREQNQGRDINTVPITGKADDVNKNPLSDIMAELDQGFVPLSTVQRVSHLLS